ncbi:uncharacterized protein LOC127807847 isoform X2 [Diospyros lotus]|uniref:uncharacterized protein LOC127807847 isoform X2 n=1 Tax=Diospyros lotus TaxID=55363 RepID=UPI00224F0FBB|nr:uncharacterized protein LOC127807847 isoform X2 [Diospyros lotus]
MKGLIERESMAMHKLVTGGSACAVPGSSSSSNPLSTLDNALIGSSKNQVEKEARWSLEVGTDVLRSRNLDAQKAHNGHQDGNADVSRQPQRYEDRSSKVRAIDKSESLIDIDDAEVCRYLNTKEEIHYKTIIWEAMNREHAKVRHGKRAAKAKKCTPARKAQKITSNTENDKRCSSKINYDALEKLDAVLNEDPKNVDIENTPSYSHNSTSELNPKLSSEGPESGKEDYNGQFVQGTDYNEGEDACTDFDSTSYDGYGEDGFGHDWDYDEEE